MHNFFITMMALLNQEINLSKVNAFCASCSKNAAPEASLCTVYKEPLKLAWYRNGQMCAFNYKEKAKAKVVVNALKASKRAAKGA